MRKHTLPVEGGEKMSKFEHHRKLLVVFHHSLVCSLFFVATLLRLCSTLALAGSIVEFLPGFELETGYIGVGEAEDVQLFYYFIKSESNPEVDPLLLWLTGGPGCSALSGLIFEIGPISIEQVEYHKGSLTKLILNPHSWTQVASIIFLDLPVGTGFSYGKNPKASHSTDLQAFDQAYEFIRKWLVDHPEFISNPFYVSGDSYSGITVPILTQLISNGNDGGIEPRINLKGYTLGNPTTCTADYNYKVPFAHGMGLISDELYQSLNENCGGEYQIMDPTNVLCLQNVDTFNQLHTGVANAHILEANCPYAAPKPKILLGGSRSLEEMFQLEFEELTDHDQVSAFEHKCRFDWYRNLYNWADDKSVQEALHIRKGTIRQWKRCMRDDLNYTRTIEDSRAYHANLSRKGYRSLIYSGDHDFLVPFLATQAWIRSLNYPIIDDWRQWTFQGTVAGYTRTYANQMTFATVKGGGHTAPEYKPPECKAMIERWLSFQPL